MNMAKKLYYSGHSACAGCPEAIAIQTILEITGPNTIISNATGCTEIVSTPYPKTAWSVPYIHVAFETAASVASGIEAANKKLGKEANGTGHVATINSFIEESSLDGFIKFIKSKNE